MRCSGCMWSRADTLLCIGDVPRYVDARPSDNLRKVLEKNPGAAVAPISPRRPWTPFDGLRLPRSSSGMPPELPASIPQFFHHRRMLEDGELLFLANTQH